LIQLFEGSSKKANQNLFLDSFELEGIPKPSNSEPLEISISIDIDANRIIKFIAEDIKSKVSKTITISLNREKQPMMVSTLVPKE
jgi:molecular chaperone DnaK (HSP70)